MRRASLTILACTAVAVACEHGDHAEWSIQSVDAQQPETLSAATPARRLNVGRDVGAARRTALVEATERVAPAVVSIHQTGRQRVQARTPWDLFFVPDAGERLVEGYGTGFIIRQDGVIVTNQHVVAGAENVTVSLADGTDLPARVLGEDALTDIAVLKVDRRGLPTAPTGRSTDLMIGEWVVALGNPFVYLLGNAEPSVSVGVVSATGRNILPSGQQPGLYLDMIQTDAAINPGNSGGPLTNALGEVIGVNSSIFSNSGGSIGLGFAIPVERAIAVADAIVRDGEVRRAWTGLDVVGPSSMRNWKSVGGVEVVSVAPGGPAERARLAPRDVLIAANGRRLRNFLDWEAVKLDLQVGDTVALEVRQGGRTTSRRLVTGDLPTVTADKLTALRDIQLVTVTPSVRAERGIRSEAGALIFRITPAASRSSGLREGDVIVAINRSAVRTAAQAGELLERRAGGMRVYFERSGEINFLDLVLR
ncbi:MAG TPA: trypsin-like peptidase domain-containing protein [Gemmatimonadales bacterium]|nr:trypsin-like peptidase domain-containing protein [Gemmatimonadales bacterium]